MMESMTEIMNKGRKCLTQHLGSIWASRTIHFHYYPRKIRLYKMAERIF